MQIVHIIANLIYWTTKHLVSVQGQDITEFWRHKSKIACSIEPIWIIADLLITELKRSRNNVLHILYNSWVCHRDVEGLVKVEYWTVLEREFETSWDLHRKGLEFQHQVKESCHVFNSYQVICDVIAGAWG